MKQNSQPHRESPSSGGMNLAMAALKAQLTMAIVGAALLVCFCAIAYAMDDPDSVTKPLSLCALLLGACCGGFSAVRMSGDGIVSGLCSGALSALLVFALSLLPVPSSGLEMPQTLFFYLGILGAAAAGSVIGKRRKSTSHNKRQAQIAKKRRA